MDYIENRICRSCLRKTEDLSSIFKEGKICGYKTTLSSILSEVTSININEDDNLPPYLCERCMLSLSKAYVFVQTFIKSDKILKNRFKDENNKNNEEYFTVEPLDSPDQCVQISSNEDYCQTEDEPPINDHQQMATYIVDTFNVENINNYQDIDGGLDVKNFDKNLGIFHRTEWYEDDNESTECYKGDNESTEYYKDDKESSDNSKFDEYCETDVDIEECDIEDTIANANAELIIETDNNFDLVRRRRRRQAIPGPPYKCEVCGKMLSNRSSHQYHMQLHSDQTPYLCSKCGEKFKTRNALEGHMMTHDDNNPHTCHVCGKAYRQAGSLKSHMLNHTGERPYVCNICGKGMTQKSGYKKHMMTHTGEKPFQCDICGKYFRYSSNLNAHRRCNCLVHKKKM